MIYLDNGATTRICEEALQVYLDVSREHFGNPSSLHAVGFDAEGVLKNARADILKALGAKDGTLIFTPGEMAVVKLKPEIVAGLDDTVTVSIERG